MTLKNDQPIEELHEAEEDYVPTMKEKFLKSQIQIPKWTVRHNDNLRMKWDIFVMALAIWNCISIPFDVAFQPEMSTVYIVFEHLVDFFFGLDIIISFRTTYINEKTGFEVVEAKKIAWNYFISGRFFVDLAASIPFESVYMLMVDIQEDEDNLELKLLGLLKLVRLLRLGRIIRYLKFK